MMNRHLLRVLLALIAAVGIGALPAGAQTRFEVAIDPALHARPLTGRLLLILGRSAEPEPRLVMAPHGPPFFGLDLERLQPNTSAIIDQGTLGYPAGLADLAPGEYWAQAVVSVYSEARRADGHTIWVALNDGMQEFLTTAAGNLYSEPQRVQVGDSGTVRLHITKQVPPRTRPRDNPWVRHVQIRSEKLSRFWGRPIFVNATVLLPKGYDEHPETRFPTIYTFGHSVPFSFTPDSTRARNIGQINAVTGLETGYDFYKSWNAEGFPRVVAISFQQQTPFFADSYSVNSANNGPYGDALIEEVIPYLETRFRLISRPYARIVEGASTGGWQTLALQLHHPDFFGGAWVLQPDPIDFRRYQLVDIYQDENAFTLPIGAYKSVERPFRRTVEGQVVWTLRDLSRFEAVLGSSRRGGYQLGAWEAVYGPVGDDGYPKPLWDPMTGRIDRDVAHYMRDHGFDLRAYAEQNWATIGPKLTGKLHFFAGDMDDFYLNLAVYRFQEFLAGTKDPHHTADFTYGRPMKGHSWHAFTWADMVRAMAEHIRRNAGTESTAPWNY
jgi:hypothetical protein